MNYSLRRSEKIEDLPTIKKRVLALLDKGHIENGTFYTSASAYEEIKRLWRML